MKTIINGQEADVSWESTMIEGRPALKCTVTVEGMYGSYWTISGGVATLAEELSDVLPGRAEWPAPPAELVLTARIARLGHE